MTDPIKAQEALAEIENYFDQRADAEYHTDSPAPTGNEEMRLLENVKTIRAALTAAAQPQGDDMPEIDEHGEPNEDHIEYAIGTLDYLVKPEGLKDHFKHQYDRVIEAARQAWGRPTPPEGMALVPVEPTEKMCWAGWRAKDAVFSSDAEPMRDPANCYRAMIAAIKEQKT